jgi:RNA polymerase sigma factor for flagellar operon FliA
MSAASDPPLPFEPRERERELREHSGLVRRIAARIRARLPPGVDMDELLQAGLIGLNEAIERYEARFGASFDTYASRRIEGAMLDSLRSEDALSRDARARQREIRNAVQAIEHRLLRAPRASEVACELGWSLAKLHRSLVEAGAAPMRAGDRELDDEAPRGASSLIDDDEVGDRDEQADPLRALQRAQRSAALNAAFDQLEERERTVMQIIYERGLEHRDAAASLGVSQARVSQMHSAIIEKLKRRLRDW